MVLLSLVTSLVLVCIYVGAVMHIYTGIKYITLYNIIYVCGIQGIACKEVRDKGLGWEMHQEPRL